MLAFVKLHVPSSAPNPTQWEKTVKASNVTEIKLWLWGLVDLAQKPDTTIFPNKYSGPPLRNSRSFSELTFKIVRFQRHWRDDFLHVWPHPLSWALSELVGAVKKRVSGGFHICGRLRDREERKKQVVRLLTLFLFGVRKEKIPRWSEWDWSELKGRGKKITFGWRRWLKHYWPGFMALGSLTAPICALAQRIRRVTTLYQSLCYSPSHPPNWNTLSTPPHRRSHHEIDSLSFTGLPWLTAKVN